MEAVVEFVRWSCGGESTLVAWSVVGGVALREVVAASVALVAALVVA